mgnify:CR=1 FL=1
MPPRLHPSIITVVLSASAIFILSKSAEAQLPQYRCNPNNAGDGWICESNNLRQPVVSPENSGLYYEDNESTLEASPQEFGSNARSADLEMEVNTTLDHTLISTSSNSVNQERSSSEIIPDAAYEKPEFRRAGAGSPITSNYYLDWVPRAELPEDQRRGLASNCCGKYIDPSADLSRIENDPIDSETSFLTDSGLSQIDQNIITIDGKVLLQQGYRTIANDKDTTIDRDGNTILLNGNVEFREPGLLLLGSSALIDNSESINRVGNAQYVLHNYSAHGSANSIVYEADSGLVTIENGEFSRCEPENNFWKLRADNITLDQQENRGYAKNVSLSLVGIPVFYYPGTLPFPLGDESISGFLAPTTGSTRSGGFDFELPYYFSFASNFDATFSPRTISDRGTLIGLETRYLADWSMNTLNLSSLSDDKLYDSKTANILGTDSPPTADRWFVGFEHFGSLGRNWTTFVDYNATSDTDYFYDLGSRGLNLSSRTHLNRQAKIDFNSDYLRAGVNVQRIDIIDPLFATSNVNKPFDRLPQFHFISESNFWNNFKIGIKGEISSFDRDLQESLLSSAEIINGALVNGERINLEPEITWSIENPGWFARAKARYKHVEYKLQNKAALTSEDPHLGISTYSFDSGFILEKDLNRPGDNGWRQTLEPRLYYLYSGYEDQSTLPLFDTSELNFSFNQLFRDERFVGGDRVGDANQAAFAITSRILDPEGKEKARLSVGQLRYFEDRKVTMSNLLQPWLSRYSNVATKSAIAGELAFNLGNNWRINSDIQWNEDKQRLDEGVVQVRYHRDSDHLFNIAYRLRNLSTRSDFYLPQGIDPRIKQTDLSAVWPIGQNWRLLGRLNYDHSNSRNLESFAGIEWSNCCTTIRLIGREWVDEDELFLPNIEPDRGIFVQLTLNGFGNLTGGGVSSLLSDGIWGFRENDYRP